MKHLRIVVAANKQPMYAEGNLLRSVMNYQMLSPTKGTLFDSSLPQASVKEIRQQRYEGNRDAALEQVNDHIKNTLVSC